MGDDRATQKAKFLEELDLVYSDVADEPLPEQMRRYLPDDDPPHRPAGAAGTVVVVELEDLKKRA